MIMQSWLVDVRNICLFGHGWCCLCWRSIVCISGLTIMDYSPIPSWSASTWIWSIWYLALEIMLHCIALHYMALGVMSWTYGCDRTATTSFIGHNDAASYIAGYESKSSYASICIHHWFGIEMQLHTLLGMKAGVHVHWYAFLA